MHHDTPRAIARAVGARFMRRERLGTGGPVASEIDIDGAKPVVSPRDSEVQLLEHLIAWADAVRRTNCGNNAAAEARYELADTLIETILVPRWQTITKHSKAADSEPEVGSEAVRVLREIASALDGMGLNIFADDARRVADSLVSFAPEGDTETVTLYQYGRSGLWWQLARPDEPESATLDALKMDRYASQWSRAEFTRTSPVRPALPAEGGEQ